MQRHSATADDGIISRATITDRWPSSHCTELLFRADALSPLNRRTALEDISATGSCARDFAFGCRVFASAKKVVLTYFRSS